MSARDNYPILADAAQNSSLLCWTEAAAALDELDRLRTSNAELRMSNAWLRVIADDRGEENERLWGRVRAMETGSAATYDELRTANHAGGES